MSEKKRDLLTICAVVGLIVAVSGTAQANWEETFGGNAFDQTWTFGCYPNLTGTFSATIKDGAGDDDYLGLDETTAYDPGGGSYGSAFGMGFGSTEDFNDVRVGALVNITGDASRNYFGVAARANWFIDPDGSITGAPGMVVTGAYIMIYHWEDGPANVRIEILKIFMNDDVIMGTFQPEVPVPGIHDTSRYLELDVVGSDPVCVTGSIYEYKGGPLLARTPAMVDTGGNDPWEYPGLNDGVYARGKSGIFSINENATPVGYHVTFDSVSSILDGPAAACLSPADGATDVNLNADLTWVEAEFATSRELWFGKEGAMEKVVPAPAGTTYDPGPLEYGQTYQWRVDEIGSTTITGHVWTFTTLDSLLVDDMESYTDRISIETIWRDGYTCVDFGVPPNVPPVTGGCSGSVVDVASGIGGGTKAMVFNYDNDGETFIPGYPTWPYPAPMFSEIEALTDYFGINRDWTKGGVKKLLLWFYGSIGNDANPTTEQMYVKLNGSKVEYDGDMNDIREASWHQWVIDLESFGVNLENVTNICIGFGDENNTTPGGSGVVYFDDIRLYRPTCHPSFRSPDFARVDYVQDCVIDYKEVAVMAEAWLVEAVATGDANLVAWYEFEGDASDSGPYGHHGVANGSPSYTGGKIGQAINLDGVDDYVETSKTASQLSIGGGAARTTTAWVYTHAFNGGGIWDLGSHADGENWSLRTLDTDNLWRAQLHGGDFDFDVTYPSKNKWVHFALVYDGTAAGNEYRLYADGDLIGSKTRALNTTEGTTFQIGRWGSEFFDGLVDDVRIYNVVLTDVEILGLALRTDLYRDQKIDFKDFAELAAWWLDEQLWP